MDVEDSSLQILCTIKKTSGNNWEILSLGYKFIVMIST